MAPGLQRGRCSSIQHLPGGQWRSLLDFVLVRFHARSRSRTSEVKIRGGSKPNGGVRNDFRKGDLFRLGQEGFKHQTNTTLLGSLTSKRSLDPGSQGSLAPGLCPGWVGPLARNSPCGKAPRHLPQKAVVPPANCLAVHGHGADMGCPDLMQGRSQYTAQTPDDTPAHVAERLQRGEFDAASKVRLRVWRN